MADNLYPNHRAKDDRKLESWVNKPRKPYIEKESTEASVRFTGYLPSSVYEQVIKKVLPTLHGKKLKNGKPAPATITDYIRDLVMADLDKRNN